MTPGELNRGVLSALRERGHSDESIERMSPKEAFEEYCQWHGLINWSHTLWDTVNSLANPPAGEKPQPADWPSKVRPDQDHKPATGDGTPMVIVVVEGGKVQSVLSDQPGPSVAIVDYDTQGMDDSEVIPIRQDAGRTAPAHAYAEDVRVDPEWVGRVAFAMRDGAQSRLRMRG